MKLTRNEITLLVALVLALVAGELVKRFRDGHPVPIAPAKAISKK